MDSNQCPAQNNQHQNQKADEKMKEKKNEEKLGGFAFREDLPSSFFLETKKGRG